MTLNYIYIIKCHTSASDYIYTVWLYIYCVIEMQGLSLYYVMFLQLSRIINSMCLQYRRMQFQDCSSRTLVLPDRELDVKRQCHSIKRIGWRKAVSLDLIKAVSLDCSKIFEGFESQETRKTLGNVIIQIWIYFKYIYNNKQ